MAKCKALNGIGGERVKYVDILPKPVCLYHVSLSLLLLLLSEMERNFQRDRTMFTSNIIR